MIYPPLSTHINIRQNVQFDVRSTIHRNSQLLKYNVACCSHLTTKLHAEVTLNVVKYVSTDKHFFRSNLESGLFIARNCIMIKINL